MGRHALKWVALCLWMVPAWSLAQPGTDVDRDVQRAILLGKAGEFTRGLEAVEVHLDEDNRHAKAWFCLLYTSPSPRDYAASRMPSSA